jgi:GNAT superfamily N-acetyltransferase
MLETIEIRPVVSREELEACYDVWDAVFPRGRAFFQERLDYDPSYSMDTTWIAIVNGEIAAAIQLFTFRIRYGTLELKLGGIGSVATLPKFRKRGLAQRILRRQSGYMEQHGYDLSLLHTNIQSFYEQAGWVLYPKTVWSMPVAPLKQLGSVFPGCTVRTYEDSDLDPVMKLYEAASSPYYGSVIRSQEYWLGQRLWGTVQPHEFLVAESSGAIVAYLRYKSANEKQIQLADCCYLPDHEEAARALLAKAACDKPEDSIIKAYLPIGHALQEWFQQYGKGRVETNSMWKIIDFDRLVNKLVPELSRRWRQSSLAEQLKQPATLLLGLGEQEMILQFLKDEICVANGNAAVTYNTGLQLTEAQWVLLLLDGCRALEDRSMPGMDYMNVIFPDISSVFWNADHF